MRRNPFRILTVAVMLTAPAGLEAQCRAADAVTTVIINNLTRLMRATDDRVVAARKSAGLPLVEPATIAVITDTTICAKAERAYSAALRSTGSTPSGRVYVIRVGSAYVVQDPAQRGGEFTVECVLNAAFKVLSRTLG